MHSILQDIITKKLEDILSEREEISEREIVSLAAKVEKTHKFIDAITQAKQNPALIAEIKLASPTKLFFDKPTDVASRAESYKKAGVDAISVVVEKHFFKGDPKFITKIKEKIDTPILMKDFVIDPYQLYQAKKVGADAVLLIAKLVTKERLAEFVTLALAVGLEPVVEIHDNNDLEKTLATQTVIIAVNARNLSTFEVDVEAACELLQKVSGDYVKLGLSGIGSSKEVEQYLDAGVQGVLVGTGLMEAENIGDFIKELYDR